MPKPLMIRPNYFLPASHTDKLKFIAGIFLLHHGDTVDVRAQHGLVYAALKGTTQWGLETSLARIAEGGLGHGFCPSASAARMFINEVMRPVVEARRRERQLAEQIAERKRLDAIHRQGQTPESRARVAAVYAAFCRSYKTAAVEETLQLDPELVAQVPDNPKSRTITSPPIAPASLPDDRAEDILTRTNRRFDARREAERKRAAPADAADVTGA